MVDPVVKRETLRISAGTLVLSTVMQLVFLIIKRWDTTVLFGNLLGAFTAVLNFFLMCLTVQRCVNLLHIHPVYLLLMKNKLPSCTQTAERAV